jgi:hypothetical protein
VKETPAFILAHRFFIFPQNWGNLFSEERISAQFGVEPQTEQRYPYLVG